MAQHQGVAAPESDVGAVVSGSITARGRLSADMLANAVSEREEKTTVRRRPGPGLLGCAERAQEEVKRPACGGKEMGRRTGTAAGELGQQAECGDGEERNSFPFSNFSKAISKSILNANSIQLGI